VTAEAALLERLAQQTCASAPSCAKLKCCAYSQISKWRAGDVVPASSTLRTNWTTSREKCAQYERAVIANGGTRKAIEETSAPSRSNCRECGRVGRMVADLDTDVAVGGDARQLVQTPVRFRACVERIAGEVAACRRSPGT